MDFEGAILSSDTFCVSNYIGCWQAFSINRLPFQINGCDQPGLRLINRGSCITKQRIDAVLCRLTRTALRSFPSTDR